MAGIEQITKRGEEIYQDLIRDKKIDIEKDRGKFLIINTENGDFLLCEEVDIGFEDFSKKYPNKLFYTIKIGFPSVYSTL